MAIINNILLHLSSRYLIKILIDMISLMVSYTRNFYLHLKYLFYNMQFNDKIVENLFVVEAAFPDMVALYSPRA